MEVTQAIKNGDLGKLQSIVEARGPAVLDLPSKKVNLQFYSLSNYY
jgi:hypothetical protein